MEITLKKASQKDCVAFNEIQNLAFEEHSRLLNIASNNFSTAEEFINRKNCEAYKICVNGKIVGAVYLRMEGIKCEIYRIFVSPEYMNQGIGSYALDKIIEKKQQYVIFHLLTPVKLQKNVAFYKKMGFEQKKSVQEDGLEMAYFEKIISRNAVTGLKPSSGGLHLGHFVGNIEPLIKYQECAKCFFVFADLQLFCNGGALSYTKEEIDANIRLMLKQLIALGVNPQKVTFLKESIFKSDKLHELLFCSDFISVNNLQSIPLIKHLTTEGAPRASLLLYPLMQTLDFVLTDADVAFSNIDNKACVEVSNDMIKKINASSARRYKEVKLINGKLKFLMGTDGQKMSKKAGNAIFIGEELNSLKQKINSMYTGSGDLNSEKDIKNNVVFSYLYLFMDEENYNLRVKKYIEGTVSDSENKQLLYELMAKWMTDVSTKMNSVSERVLDEIMAKMNIKEN